jgi:thiamine biosynthesis lipoprotein
MRPDGEPWWVELEDPPACPLPPLRIALHQLAVATSGQYLGAHTLDPRTGRPPTHETVAVSVLHSSCMLADAWASALGAAAPVEARRLAAREGLAVRLVAWDGSEWLSDALRRML